MPLKEKNGNPLNNTHKSEGQKREKKKKKVKKKKKKDYSRI